MSSHADTIRAALVAPMPGGWGANDPEVALEALLAENQRLRDDTAVLLRAAVGAMPYLQRDDRFAEAATVALREALTLFESREALAGDAE